MGRKGVASSCLLQAWISVDREGVGDEEPENQASPLRPQLTVQMATANNADLEFAQYRCSRGIGPTIFIERLLCATRSSGVWWVSLASLPSEGFGVTDLPMQYTKRLWLGKLTFLRIEYRSFVSKF